MSDWMQAEQRLPGWGQIVLIAKHHRVEGLGSEWISYTGWRSEDRKTEVECWWADEAEMLPYAGTWWQPITPPDGTHFGLFRKR